MSLSTPRGQEKPAWQENGISLETIDMMMGGVMANPMKFLRQTYERIQEESPSVLSTAGMTSTPLFIDDGRPVTLTGEAIKHIAFLTFVACIQAERDTHAPMPKW